MKWLYLSDFDLLNIGNFTIYIFSQLSIIPHLRGIYYVFYKKKFKMFYCSRTKTEDDGQLRADNNWSRSPEVLGGSKT